MVKKSFQKIIVQKLALLLSFLIVAFCFMPFVPVFASSQSVGNIDYDVLGTSDTVMELTINQASFVIGDQMSTLRVPVYLRYTSSTIATYSWAYWSGILRYNIGINWCGVDSNSPINVNPAYFDGVQTDNLHVLWNTSKGLRIYFDNFRLDSAQSSYREIFLGYLVYQFQAPSSAFTYTFPTAVKSNNTVVNQNLRSTAYEYGFAEAMIYAIDTSTDIDEILTWLIDISQNTSYLPSIVTGLNNINGILGSIFNYLGTMDQNQYSSMRQLVWALSGVDFASTQNSALAQATYDRWVQLIYDAINYQGPDASAANQEADNLEAAHDQNDLAQEAAYTYMDNALDDINFAVTVPQGLINSALTIGGYITQIWQNAGSDFQFLVTATLTIGLITVVIGAINRYPKTVTNSETTQETYGVRNGKPYRHISHTSRHTTHHSK